MRAAKHLIRDTIALIITILLLPVIIVIYTVGAIKRIRNEYVEYHYRSDRW